MTDREVTDCAAVMSYHVQRCNIITISDREQLCGSRDIILVPYNKYHYSKKQYCLFRARDRGRLSMVSYAILRTGLGETNRQKEPADPLLEMCLDALHGFEIVLKSF